MAKKALGRGLGALIPSEDTSFSEKESIQEIPIARIEANTFQPRSHFEEQKLNELAESIREKGVIQPIVVIRQGEGYQLVSGERRTRAALLAGFDSVPAIVRKYSDRDRAEIAIVENIQREDLNPLEEASAYQTLMEEFGLTQSAMAEQVGRSRAHIANTLRLLDLGQQARAYLSSGKISAGHARALLVLSPVEQELLAARVAAEGLSVRETEKLVRLAQKKRQKREKPAKVVPVEVEDMQIRLQERFATKVRIHYGEDRGKIEIEYYSPDDLLRITDLLAGE